MRHPLRTVTAACATALACTGLALAASPPTATTTAATAITETTATLNGTVDPEGTDTSWYFEYGTTTAYGARTATQGPEKGNAAKSVSSTVTGLAPSTTYHYRLVASSAAGTSNGADMTFTTGAPGTSPGITIAANKKAVTFGRPVTIVGRIVGPDSAGQNVTLEFSDTPTATTFSPAGQTATSDATGAFSFTVNPAATRRYRVTAKGKNGSTSNEVTVGVRVHVRMGVSDRTPRKGQRVFFSGSVLPGHEGVIAKIQKRTAKGWRTVATTPLIAASPLADGTTRSTYTKGVRVRRDGTYRVRVNPADGDHLRGTSRKRKIDVRG
jgi:hypothetical protein